MTTWTIMKCVFIDLRYRSKGYYPFVAIVQLNKDLQIVSSYTGWIFSEEKLRKKIRADPKLKSGPLDRSLMR
ncbi:hypothetical protein GCM10020331_089220 [Ectobacillus funiculus]